MSQRQGFTFLKQKITIGYLILVVTGLAAILILYKGVGNIISIDRDDMAPNQKLYLTNKLLTLIYDAESDARGYYLFRRKKDLNNYVSRLEEIKSKIDTGLLICSDNIQQIRSLEKIKELLMEQQSIVHKLVSFDRKNEQDVNIQRALDEIYIQAYEIIPPARIIRKNTVIRHDSVYKETPKSSFFGKIKNLFSSQDANPEKQSPNVSVEKITTVDTIVQSRPLPDSILKIMKRTLENLRLRDNYVNSKVISSETQLLHSDRIILDRIREMVASLETEELASTEESINLSKAIIHKTVLTVIWLAGISFLLILIFVYMIFKDIGRNKRYNLALQEARVHSEELARTKEQFLAMMSHEIRTPLSSIIGFAEQFQKTRLTEEQEVFLSRIRKSSDFLLSLVNDILDLSKMNAGKMVFDRILFKPSEVIQEVYQSFTGLADAKSLELILQGTMMPDLEVAGDPLRFRQVLTNLTGNALKFTREGSVTIRSEILSEGTEHATVRVTVSDTGIGIPLEKQAHIFEEFTQADTGVTRNYGGTGLGLAIACKIVEASGGALSVSSTPSEGSTFTVDMIFPKGKGEIAGPLSVVSVFPDQLLTQKQILVVDDDETMLILISSMLVNLGAEAYTAESAKSALDMFGDRPFDIIITDLNMPQMNGMELLRILQASQPHLPVVAITANSQVDTKFDTGGFSGFLSKPFREAELYQELVRILYPEYKGNLENQAALQVDAPETRSSPSGLYSLEGVIDFVGSEPETLRTIVQSFVTNSLATIGEMKDLADSSDFEAISGKAHKLLPLFRQFQINSVVSDLETLERYKELEIAEEDLKRTAEKAAQSSEEIIGIIASDCLS